MDFRDHSVADAAAIPGNLRSMRIHAKANTNEVPIARLIGFEANEIADGRAVVTLAAGSQHANPWALSMEEFSAI